MTRFRTVAVLGLTLGLVLLPGSGARARDWYVSGGGDQFRSGYNPEERPPYFATGNPVDQPNPEWVTKLSDLPSGLFPMGGPIVAEGKVFIGGGSTNAIWALDQATGVPVWAFQPDPRGSRTMPGDGYAGNYPATNAPWYNDGILYVSFSNGTVYALHASNGRKLWRFEIPPPGGPREVTDHVLPSNVKWDFSNPDHRANPLRAEVAPYTGDYPKLHAVVGYCDGKVHLDTLDSRMYVLDAANGSIIWHRYVGAPDWPGEFVWPEAERGGITPESGRSTRRFEADPGTGCLDQYMFVVSEDGFVKLFDKDTGEFLGAYDAFHDGDLGFAHDIGAGLADPESRDLVVNTLSNRMIRVNVPQMTPQWAHTEDAGQLSLCLNRADRDTCEVVPTTQDVEIDGPIGGAVFGGNLSLDYEHRVIANANQDGHLYLFEDIDVEGQNPTLLARIANQDNPFSKTDPPSDSLSYYLPRGKGGPWDQRTSVLSSSVMGGGVVYWNATWEHAIYGAQYLDASGQVLDEPRTVFRYEVNWDDTFQYPPFGDTFAEPIIDIDLLTWGSPALVDGHLYTQANDGSIYSFNLMQPVGETRRNLAVLGSGLVPFIPTWQDPRGTFDRVWTSADWYKNQVAPEGFNLPTPAVALPVGVPLIGLGVWFWLRRRTRGGPGGNPPRRDGTIRRIGPSRIGNRSYWWP